MTMNNISSAIACLFKVEAKNSEGLSLPTTLSQPVYSAGPPNRSLNVTTTRTETGFNISWTPPANDPTGVTGYTITYSPD